jgi:uncharacterized membrane protein YfcA
MGFETYLWISIIVFFAAFTQGLSGFGSVLLALPLLAIFLEIKTVIPLAALYGVSITILLLLQLRRHLEWRKILPLVVGAALGIPVGVFLLKRLNRDVILWVLGVFLVAYSLYGLFSKAWRGNMRESWGYLFGFFGGCFGGAFAASGPAVIVYTSLQGWNKDTIKVTLQGFFVFSGLMVVSGHAISGVTTWAVVRLYLGSLPALILGTYVGSYCYGMIGEQGYRKVMFILLAFLGAVMISKAA